MLQSWLGHREAAQSHEWKEIRDGIFKRTQINDYNLSFLEPRG